jgi:hypothetical protein
MNVWRYLLALFFVHVFSHAAIPHSNPRAIAMAGAYSGIGLGVEAPLANPANLSLPTSFTWSMALFQVAGWGYNNSYSLAHYNRYSGAYLNATAKQDILNVIPDQGMDFHGRLEVQPFAIAYGPFAFSVLLQVGARGWLDKEVVSLLLFGNKVDYRYDLHPADLDATAMTTYMASYAVSLPTPTEAIQHWGLGLNVKYLKGHYSAQLEKAAMHTETLFSSAAADGYSLMRTAEGGNGFGLDLGMTTTFYKRWRASLVVENVVGQMAWNKKTEVMTADFIMNSTNVDRILTDDLEIDDVIVSHDTTLAAPGFTTTLPMTVRLGVTRGFKNIYLAAELAHSLRTSALTSKKTLVALGAEFQPGSVVRFRTGMRFGGDAAASWCGGVGLLLGLVRWDMAVQTVGGLAPKDLKGLGLATGFCIWY